MEPLNAGLLGDESNSWFVLNQWVVVRHPSPLNALLLEPTAVLYLQYVTAGLEGLRQGQHWDFYTIWHGLPGVAF